ncbi:MAG: hypothetical protein HY774_28295 [Acidobacteria bacterium]|nr:hypothetical protein [Acidobacteriota bacterium]
MHYKVIFERAGDGSPQAQALVHDRLITHFKVSPEVAAAMLQQAPLVVKQGLTQDQAEAYQQALESIGVVASLELTFSMSDAPTAPNSPQPASAPVPPPPPPPTALTMGGLDSDIAAVMSGSTQISDPPQAGWSPSVPFASPLSSGTVQIPSNQPSAPPPPAITLEKPKETPPVSAITDTADWWAKLRVWNPPLNEAGRGMTPMTTGRVTATSYGFTLAHPMVSSLNYEDIHLIAVFQSGYDSNQCKRYVDIFAPAANRPVRLDCSFINFDSFQVPPAEDQRERITYFVRILLQRCPNSGVDLATYRFLRDVERLKTVNNEREVEKYVSRLFEQTEIGNTPETNPQIMAGHEAETLRDKEDPWMAPPPPPPPPDPPFAQSGFPPAFPGGPMASGMSSAPPGGIPQPGFSGPLAPPPNVMYNQSQMQAYPNQPEGEDYDYDLGGANVLIAKKCTQIALATSITGLVLLMLSLAIPYFWLGIGASVVGLFQAQKAIRIYEGNNQKSNAGPAQGAFVMGIIGFIILVVSVLAFAFKK